MAILGFKERFVDLIRSGKKRQTIRAFRKHPIFCCEHLYLYCGLRTNHTVKICEAQCTGTWKIRITNRSVIIYDMLKITLKKREELDRFARQDGFSSWNDMKEFWKSEHGDDCFPFTGTIIYFHMLSLDDWGRPLFTRKQLAKQYA